MNNSLAEFITERVLRTNHFGLNLVLEATGRTTAVSEDDRAVTVLTAVHQLEALGLVRHSDDRENRAEDLIVVDGRFRIHPVE